MEIQLKPFDLELKHTFTISRESHNKQPTLIVELKDEGFIGLGEATSNPYYKITVDKMVEDIISLKPKIEELNGLIPEEFWSSIYPHLKTNMFALCALDLAYNDLYAKKKNKKLFELWEYNVSNNPLTDYTIGLDSVENMVYKMRELPWPIYKIKLGTKDDLKIIRELRKHSDSIFRVDANCGWDAETTIENSKALKQLGVEFIEQPLPAGDWEMQKKVFHESSLPLIADESCQIESDVKKCKGYFHGVNVKLVKCGGLTPARRMLVEAKKLNLKTMVGCMTESSVGISAIAHLLPLLDYVDMDGPLLLKKDIAKGVNIINGEVHYSDGFGTGASLIV